MDLHVCGISLFSRQVNNWFGEADIYIRFLAFMIATLTAQITNLHAQERVGNATDVVRRVAIMAAASPNAQAPLAISDPVNFKDTLFSQSESNARVLLLDDTRFFIGENSQVRFDEFVFDPAISGGELSVRFVKGVFRFASGASKRGNVTLVTPVAQIGIRGTVFSLVVEGDGASTIRVEEGAVSFGPIGGTQITVNEGQTARVEPGGEAEQLDVAPASFTIPVAIMTTNLAINATPAAAIPIEVVNQINSLSTNISEAAQSSTSQGARTGGIGY